MEPVKEAEWAALIVTVFKLDQINFCIYGHFKQIVNPISTYQLISTVILIIKTD